MDPLEILGFVTGAVCVWLAARENVWTFPVGIANNVVFAVLFVGSGLYAGAALQVVYLVLGVLGWWWWVRGGEDRGPLTVRTAPRWAWPVAVVAALTATAVLTWVLGTWTDSTVPFWDGLTTGLSLVAQLMLNRKWIGTWYVWILTDVLLVGLYVGLGLYVTAALYLLFIGLCVHGLRTWRRAAAVGAAADATPAGTPPSAHADAGVGPA
ncbi:nicotinamide mononucleotide transporter [Cellulomonas sp. APG4]|uniref:nicotinamide riboside transporter PnuC n=1 Tax=Cellulomonas sp. APG4 TaxID=1538656 RepID=UPI001379CC82|nr:nicotinamide mononucleotide transporter [Cellulomonas sp. APG4]